MIDQLHKILQTLAWLVCMPLGGEDNQSSFWRCWQVDSDYNLPIGKNQNWVSLVHWPFLVPEKQETWRKTGSTSRCHPSSLHGDRIFIFYWAVSIMGVHGRVTFKCTRQGVVTSNRWGFYQKSQFFCWFNIPGRQNGLLLLPRHLAVMQYTTKTNCSALEFKPLLKWLLL